MFGGVAGALGFLVATAAIWVSWILLDTYVIGPIQDWRDERRAKKEGRR